MSRVGDAVRRAYGVDADPVAPGLWIGSFNADDAKLRAAGFEKVIRLAMERTPVDFPLDDSADVGMRFLDPAMAAAASATRNLVRGRMVLVQCNQGRNRSGFVVAAVLIKRFGLSAADAVARVKAARANALTNGAFVRKLEEI